MNPELEKFEKISIFTANQWVRLQENSWICSFMIDRKQPIRGPRSMTWYSRVKYRAQEKTFRTFFSIQALNFKVHLWKTLDINIIQRSKNWSKIRNTCSVILRRSLAREASLPSSSALIGWAGVCCAAWCLSFRMERSSAAQSVSKVSLSALNCCDVDGAPIFSQLQIRKLKLCKSARCTSRDLLKIAIFPSLLEVQVLNTMKKIVKISIYDKSL